MSRLNVPTANVVLAKLGVHPYDDDPAEYDRLFRSLEQHWEAGGSVMRWLADQREMRKVTASKALRQLTGVYE